MGNEIQSWYKSEAATPYWEAEAHSLKAILPNCFGYHLVQMGGPNNSDWLEPSPIKHKVRLAEPILNGDDSIVSSSSMFSSQVISELSALPFAPNSVDVFLLPHTLEYCSDPRIVLKEVVQALMPEGCVVIFGFNPVSPWGLQHYLMRKKNPLWLKNVYTLGTMRRWLIELDCEIGAYRSFTSYNPAISVGNRAKWERFIRSHWHFIGGLYMITAHKRVAAVTPIRLQPSLINGLAESDYSTQCLVNRRSKSSDKIG